MSDREGMLLARLLTEENRSKAAEARCARLEAELAELFRPERKFEAADMRERAAKLVERKGHMASWAVADYIRALPIDEGGKR